MDFTTLQTALTLCVDIAFLWGAIIVTIGILDISTRNSFVRSADFRAMKLMASKPMELPAAIESAIAIEVKPIIRLKPIAAHSNNRDDLSSKELKTIAKDQKVKGWGSMTKAQLIAAIAR